MISRRERTEQMLAETPGDPFLRYVLAMEWSKEGELEKALELFRGLMADSPPYVPAFLMAAQRLHAADRIAEARAVLRDGIEAARRAGDSHADAEMGDLLAMLGSAGEG